MTSPTLHTRRTDAETAEESAETRMRQVLGKLGTGGPVKASSPRHATQQARPAAHRHRFRQDGEIPVVRLALLQAGRGGERQVAAPAVDACERDARSDEARNQNGAESARQVQELSEQLHRARTRLGHAELALEEAGRLARASQVRPGCFVRPWRTAGRFWRSHAAPGRQARPLSLPWLAARLVGHPARPVAPTARTRQASRCR